MNAKKAKSTTATVEERSGSRMSKQKFLEDILSADEEDLASTTATETPTKEQKKAAAPTLKQQRQEKRTKMSDIRKVIASRLLEVQRETAMLTTFNTVDMSAVLAIQENYQETFLNNFGVPLSIIPFFVKAALSALQAFPALNSFIDGDDVVQREYFDIGIAIDSVRGLIVPVIRNCDALAFYDVEHLIKEFADKATDGSLAVEDLQGGSFTITNSGLYNSWLSTPMLNPPQSSILGMHTITEQAIVIDGSIVVRPIMNLALTFDNRLIDNKDAVSFLAQIKHVIEDPARMLLNA